MWKIIYENRARKDILKLPSQIIDRIIDKLEFFASQENPLYFAIKLQNTIVDRYRFRVGDYRIIFKIDSAGTIKILLILTIKHRREVYRI